MRSKRVFIYIQAGFGGVLIVLCSTLNIDVCALIAVQWVWEYTLFSFIARLEGHKFPSALTLTERVSGHEKCSRDGAVVLKPACRRCNIGREARAVGGAGRQCARQCN